jgi:hypothetical protein
MMKNWDKKFLKDVKVIPSDEVFIQHMLAFCDLSITMKKENNKVYVPKLKSLKLTDKWSGKNLLLMSKSS